jgi:hypothetical protein
MSAGELATAEAAFAAIDAVDKLQYVLHLKALQAGGGAGAAAAGAASGGSGGGGRDPLVASELAVYAGQVDEAEATLLQVCVGGRELQGSQSLWQEPDSNSWRNWEGCCEIEGWVGMEDLQGPLLAWTRSQHFSFLQASYALGAQLCHATVAVPCAG